MKEFINKHPVITIGILYGFCKTIIRVVSIIKERPMSEKLIVIVKTSDDASTENKDAENEDGNLKEEIKNREV